MNYEITAKFKFWNFGGNANNAISKTELSKINICLLNRLKKTGFKVFGLILKQMLKICPYLKILIIIQNSKRVGFYVMVTVSWFRSYAWTQDSNELMADLLKSSNIDIIAPQMYTSNCNDAHIYVNGGEATIQ